MDKHELNEVVKEAVKATLLELGISTADPIEFQKDMAFIRELRLTSAKVREKGLMVLVGIILTALAGALWVGFRGALGKS